jgi:hypothetical protein
LLSVDAQGSPSLPLDDQLRIFRLVTDSLSGLLTTDLVRWDAERILIDDSAVAESWGVARARITDSGRLRPLREAAQTPSTERWLACWARRRDAGVECPGKRSLVMFRAPAIRFERDGSISFTGFLWTGYPSAWLERSSDREDGAPWMTIGATVRRTARGEYQIVRLLLIGHS